MAVRQNNFFASLPDRTGASAVRAQRNMANGAQASSFDMTKNWRNIMCYFIMICQKII